MAKAAYLAVGTLIGVLALTYATAGAQTPVPSGDAAVAALVTEVRALRADLAASSQRAVHAQLLLGRLAMQEQRIAYLDKQRSDVTAKALEQQRTAMALAGQARDLEASNCTVPRIPQEDCEIQLRTLKRQAAAEAVTDQSLRQEQRDAENALAAEQARWTDFNTRLDDLERAIR